jgi:hypothetical protein
VGASHPNIPCSWEHPCGVVVVVVVVVVVIIIMPVPVAALSKSRMVLDRSNARIVGSIPARGMGIDLCCTVLCR